MRASRGARQLRWDPGKQTLSVSHTAVTKAAGLAGVPTGLVLGCWASGCQGADCLETGLEGLREGGSDAACRFKGASDPIG